MHGTTAEFSCILVGIGHFKVGTGSGLVKYAVHHKTYLKGILYICFKVIQLN
jgi:hypothetical protein